MISTADDGLGELRIECKPINFASEVPFGRIILGRKTAYLNGEPISGERAEEILAARRAAQ